MSVLQPQAPKEVLLVKDEREASSFVVHLVLLCRIQKTDAVSFQEEDKAEYWAGIPSQAGIGS